MGQTTGERGGGATPIDRIRFPVASVSSATPAAELEALQARTEASGPLTVLLVEKDVPPWNPSGLDDEGRARMERWAVRLNAPRAGGLRIGWAAGARRGAGMVACRRPALAGTRGHAVAVPSLRGLPAAGGGTELDAGAGRKPGPVGLP